MFCRVSHFYGMGYREVLSLPMRTFWLMDSCVSRIQAEKDMRAVAVAAHATTGEAMQQIRTHLTVEMGEVMKLDPLASAVRDEAGFQRLKAMSK